MFDLQEVKRVGLGQSPNPAFSRFASAGLFAAECAYVRSAVLVLWFFDVHVNATRNRAETVDAKALWGTLRVDSKWKTDYFFDVLWNTQKDFTKSEFIRRARLYVCATRN